MRNIGRISFFISAAAFFLILAACPAVGPAGGTPTIGVADGSGALASGATRAFGSIVTGTSGAPVVFTVSNSGNGNLNLSGSPAVVKSGTNAAEFTVAQPAIVVIGPAASTTFTVTFSPSSIGAKTASIILTTDDPATPKYTLNLTGTGTAVPVPEINLKHDGADVASGGGASFGNVTVSQSSAVHTFTIENLGSAALTLTGNPLAVAKNPPGDTQFTVTQPASASIAGGATVTFTVVFSPTSMGVKTCTLIIPNNDADEGTYSVVMSGEGTETPSAPTGLNATTPLNNRIDLTWTDNSTIETGFRLDRKIDAGSWTVDYQTFAANTTSFSNTNLALGYTYTYRVRAVNGYGDSSYSNEAGAAAQLPAPSGLAATPVAVNEIDLSWTDNSNIEQGFRIERGTTVSGPWSEINVTAANAVSYQDKGAPLTANTTWYYRVRAYYITDYSTYSNTASTTTLPTWTVETPDSNANDVGKFSSIKLTGDSPRIAYYDATARRPKYATYSTSWSSSSLDTVNSGQYTSLALNGSGYPRIGYYDDSAAPYNLRYAEYNGSTWTYTSLDQDASADTGSYTALALDSNGDAQITYWAEAPANAGTLAKNIRKSSGSWQTAVAVDSDYLFRNNKGGEWNALAVNGTTRHTCYSGIYYIDAAGNNVPALRYSTSTNGTAWTEETVTYKASGATNPYQYSSIAYYGSTVYIAYYDSVTGNLCLATRSGSWSVQTVKSGTGTYCSLGVDSVGDLHISYYNAGTGDLCYTYSADGTTWSATETVDSTGTVGQYSSISIGSNDYPRISYYDVTNTNLKFARKNKPVP